MGISYILNDENRAAAIDAMNRRRYVRRFTVRTTNSTDGPLQVRVAPGIPRIFDIYTTGTEVDTGSRCHDITVDPVPGDPLLWRVTCEYTNDFRDVLKAQEENPLLRPAKLSWQSQPWERPLLRDLDGRPILNSADEPFDPPITVDDSRPVLRVVRNQLAYDENLRVLYQDAVNSDIWFGQPVRTVKVHTFDGERKWENGIWYWEVSYEFHFRRETWIRQVLDAGFRYLDSAGDPVHFIDRDGNLMHSPGLLNGFGGRLTAATGPLDGLIDAEQTYLDVTSPNGEKFPGNTDLANLLCTLRCEDELMRYVEKDETFPNRLHVIRGVDGTTAATHADTTDVTLEPVYRLFRTHKELPFSVLGIF